MFGCRCTLGAWFCGRSTVRPNLISFLPFTESFEDDNDDFLADVNKSTPRPLNLSDVGRQLAFYKSVPDQQASASITGCPQSMGKPPASIQLKINTVFKELPELKRLFGVFQLFSGTDAEQWVDMIVGYLNHNFQSPNEFCKYFQSFLERDFQIWWFGLPAEQKEDLGKLKSAFFSSVSPRNEPLTSYAISARANFSPNWPKIGRQIRTF